jgi:abnormal spindle-like microcephaly-associated protein
MHVGILSGHITYCLFSIMHRFQQQREAAAMIQAYWRGAVAAFEYQQLRQAATILQAAYRGYQVRMVIQASQVLVTFLQACYRCRRERGPFLKLRRAAVVLQAAFRGQQARRRCDYIRAVANPGNHERSLPWDRPQMSSLQEYSWKHSTTHLNKVP